MTRALSPDVIDELLSSGFAPCLLYEGVFSTSTLRLWNGIGNLTYDSNTYLGNGWFQGINPNNEVGSIEATGVEIRLAGVPESLISLVFNNPVQGATGNFYIGFLDSSNALIADPYLFFSGKLDVPTIDEDPESPSISISYESKLIDLDRPREFRYTNESQQVFFSGDRGLEYLIYLQEYDGFWGGVKVDVKKKKK